MLRNTDSECLMNDVDVKASKEGFIAGAEWQKKLDDLETADLLAIAHLQGMEQQKAKMLEDAVEGEVMLNPYPTICLDDCKDYDFKDGNKVRVIVIPNTDEK